MAINYLKNTPLGTTHFTIHYDYIKSSNAVYYVGYNYKFEPQNNQWFVWETDGDGEYGHWSLVNKPKNTIPIENLIPTENKPTRGNSTMQKHAALIKLWADGVSIQRKQTDGGWKTEANPTWKDSHEYRALPVRFTKDEWYAFTMLDGTKLVGMAIGTHAIKVHDTPIGADEILKAVHLPDLQF